MKNFSEIEKEFSGTLLHGHHNDQSAIGTLIVSGKTTILKMTGTKSAGTYHEDGFFSFSSYDSNGRKILFHKCVNLGNETSTSRPGKVTEKAFPNIICFDAESLTKDGRLNEVVFCLDIFNEFFRYDFIETHHFFDAPKTLTTKIRQIRATADNLNKYMDYTRTYDFFSPVSIHISHGPKKIADFSVSDVKYQITSGESSGFGGNSLNLETRFYARIYWRKSVSVDEALDAVWAWKRFFSQIASQDVEPSRIAARASGAGKRRASSNLYLPNIVGSVHTPNPWNFGPANVPYREWHERLEFSVLMARWLGAEAERKRFRVLLNSVISRMHARYDLNDIVTLCAAVESISPSSHELYSGEIIGKLVEATHLESKTLGLDISLDRISGLIKQLNQKSLITRLKEIFVAIAPAISPAEQKILIRNIVELRTIAAHGHVITEMTIPKLAPTVSALASSLILFDQITSGLPISEARLIARTDLTMSIGSIMRIHGERKLRTRSAK